MPFLRLNYFLRFTCCTDSASSIPCECAWDEHQIHSLHFCEKITFDFTLYSQYDKQTVSCAKHNIKTHRFVHSFCLDSDRLFFGEDSPFRRKWRTMQTSGGCRERAFTSNRIPNYPWWEEWRSWGRIL